MPCARAPIGRTAQPSRPSDHLLEPTAALAWMPHSSHVCCQVNDLGCACAFRPSFRVCLTSAGIDEHLCSLPPLTSLTAAAGLVREVRRNGFACTKLPAAAELPAADLPAAYLASSLSTSSASANLSSSMSAAAGGVAAGAAADGAAADASGSSSTSALALVCVRGTRGAVPPKS
eukprot:27939-Pleurochrysis_carterae.AAC.1